MARLNRKQREGTTTATTTAPTVPTLSPTAPAPFAVQPGDTAAVIFAKRAFELDPDHADVVGLDLVVFHRELGAFLQSLGLPVDVVPVVDPRNVFNPLDMLLAGLDYGVQLGTFDELAGVIVDAARAGMVPRGVAVKVCRKVERAAAAARRGLRELEVSRPADEPAEDHDAD
jgi:hypothetical protein